MTGTPTLPVGARACRAADLTGKAHAQGATGSIFIGMQLINTSATICTLQGPPEIQLMDERGQVLDIDYYVNCFLCNEYSGEYVTPLPATITAHGLTATVVVRNVLYGKIGMGSGEWVGVSLIWELVPASA